MMRVFLFLLFVVFGLHASAETRLIAAEYFIDIDPGEGNGIAINCADGNFESAIEELLATGITSGNGTHIIGIRVKAVNGQWSPVFRSIITTVNNVIPQVTIAEFFIGSDPGTGNGQPMIAFDGNFNNCIETVLSSGVSVSTGTFKINIRILGSNGQWSPVFSTVISSTALREINVFSAEYFIDQDPGTGNGSPMIAFDGNFNTAIETVVQSGIAIPAGSHVFNVRVKDKSNNWSPVFKSSVHSQSLRELNLVQAEAFIDTDPGTGNGTPLIALDGNLNNAIETVYTNAFTGQLPTGNFKFNVRVKDKENHWSPVFSTSVSVLSMRNIRISQCEIFVDNDPGIGNGIPLVAFDGQFDNAIETVSGTLTALSNGGHTLHIRCRDAKNIWSPVFSTTISRVNIREIAILSGEYFLGNDPGTGNGTLLICFDGNFDQAIEKIIASFTNSTTGPQRLSVRVKDKSNNWSPVFSSVISTGSLNRIQVLQAEYFWDSDPGEGNGNTLLALDGSFDESLEQLFAQIQPLRGSHKFSVRIKQSQGTWSPPFSMIISKMDNSAGILYVKLFLQGFYRGNGQMAAVIDPIVKPALCDTISMSLVSAISPYPVVHSDTTILSISGDAYFSFPEIVFNNSYYIVLNHHNSLQTWSGLPVTFTTDTISYDFTHNSNSAYGENLFSFPDGRTALFAGDITGEDGMQDGSIDLHDYYLLQSDLTMFIAGYHKDDLNGDHVIESADYSLLENNVEQGITVLRP
jgi:hypothetical protein